MSVQAIGWALKLTIPSTATKFVLVALANYCGPKGTCFVGQERLARDTSLSVRGVRNALQSLEEQGLIVRERRFGNGGHRTSDRIRLNASYRQDLPVGERGLPEAGAGREEDDEWEEDETLPANGDRPTGKSRPSYRHSVPGNRKRTVREPSDTLAAGAAKATVKPIYSEDFVMLWDCVPKDDNPGSKSDAAKAFNKLTAPDKVACVQGWLAYLDWLEAKRAKRADHPIKQLVSFINGRLWETYLEGRESNHG